MRTVMLLLCVCTTAFQMYQERLPNGASVERNGVVWPAVGHATAGGGTPRNSFGIAFAAAGHMWSSQLCAADSDGDGYSNGEELGDPQCVWSIGADPQRTTMISHPGFADSFPPFIDVPTPAAWANTTEPNVTTTEMPNGTTTEPTTEMPTATTTEPTTEMPTATTTEPTTEMPNGTTTEPTTETPNGTTTEPTTETPTETTTESTTEMPNETTTEPTTTMMSTTTAMTTTAMSTTAMTTTAMSTTTMTTTTAMPTTATSTTAMTTTAMTTTAMPTTAMTTTATSTTAMPTTTMTTTAMPTTTMTTTAMPTTTVPPSTETTQPNMTTAPTTTAAPPPSITLVVATLTIVSSTVDFATFIGNTTLYNSVAAALQSDVATALRMVRHYVVITRLAVGSLVADYSVEVPRSDPLADSVPGLEELQGRAAAGVADINGSSLPAFGRVFAAEVGDGTTFSASSTLVSTPSVPSQIGTPAESSGLTSGAIAGIVIAAVVLLVVLILLVAVFSSARRQKKPSESFGPTVQDFQMDQVPFI